MTDDLSSLPWYPDDDERTPNGAAGRKPCRHHHLLRRFVVTDATTHPVTGYSECGRCHERLDPMKARRGKSAARLGKDQERRIERVYGPRKVGEYGDAVDHLGRDFKWQAKSTRKPPPIWLTTITEPTFLEMVPKSILDPMAHMTGIGGARRPLVIRSYVHQGLPTRDWLFVTTWDWRALHGGYGAPGYLVIPGADFLAIHGRDEA